MPQSLSRVLDHLVFSTKDRSPVLAPAVGAELHAYLVGVLRENGCQPIRIGGVEDHVHIFFGLSRTLKVRSCRDGKDQLLKVDQDPKARSLPNFDGRVHMAPSPLASQVRRQLCNTSSHNKNTTERWDSRTSYERCLSGTRWNLTNAMCGTKSVAPLQGSGDSQLPAQGAAPSQGPRSVALG